jgi:hypothetical protein
MLIGFTGYKESGKDTAGQVLIENGYTKLALADQLKRAVANLFDIPIEWVDILKTFDYQRVEVHHHMSSEVVELPWRLFLQRFGTEMGRNTFGQDFWVNQWNDMYDAMFVLEPDKAPKVVVTDVRFQNEATRIHSLGGTIIEIQRPGYGSDGHASEAGIPQDLIDATIHNDGDLDLLRSRVLTTVSGL